MNFLRAQNDKFYWMKPEMKPPGASFYAWSRSRPKLIGAGVDPIWSEPESAPEPRIAGAGATQKSGGSAALSICTFCRKM